MSAYRTVRFLLPVPGFIVQAQLQWTDKRPLDYESFALDMTAWLVDGADTIASVTAGTLQAGLQVGVESIAGSVVSTFLRGGIVGVLYTVDFVVTSTSGQIIDVPVMLRCVAGLAAFPTSPVMLAPGATWYSTFRNTFQIVPEWRNLPNTEISNADSFFLDGAEIHIPSNTTLFPNSPAGLAVGDIWNNGGTAMSNGNPGLPTTSSTPGALLYNGGALILA